MRKTRNGVAVPENPCWGRGNYERPSGVALARSMVGIARPFICALNHDHASLALGCFMQRKMDFVGEFLSHDQQTARALTEKLIQRSLAQHVAMKSPSHALSRRPD